MKDFREPALMIRSSSGRPTSLIRPCAIVFGLFALFSSRSGAGQEQKPLKHEVTVTLKLVQAIVTDKSGNPVAGLGKDDFALVDDGKRVALTEFEEHKLPVTMARTGEAAPAVQAPEKVLLNRKIFFFFDFMNSTPQGARKAAEAALHFVDTGLLPTDEVGVITMSAVRGVQVYQLLSSDRQQIRKAIASFGLAESSGRAEEIEDEYRRLKDAGGFADAREGKLGYSGSSAAAAAINESGGMNLIGDARYWAKINIERLTRFAQAMRYVPGQKTLVLFSTGLVASMVTPQADAVIGGTVRVSRSDPRDSNPEIRRAYEDLCRELSTSNVVVHPMNTREITAASEMKGGAATLRFMADATGGRYYANIFDYKENVARFQTVTAAYYVLGYPVNETWDGKFHRIKVSVRKPGLTVRTQEGYFSSKMFAAYDGLEKKMHLVDLALSENPFSQRPVRFEMAVLPGSDKNGAGLVLVARVPVRELKEKGVRKAETVSLLFDANDAIVAEERSEEDLAGTEDEFASFAASLPAPAGRLRCRIIVRDLETGAAAVAATSWIPPAAEAEGFALAPPLLLQPDRGAALLKIHPVRATADRSAPDRMSTLLGCDARQYVPYFGRTLAAEADIWAILPFLDARPSRAKLKLSAFLKDKLTYADIPLRLEAISDSPCFGGIRVLVRLTLPSVETDEYTLRLIAEDPGTGASAEMARDFLIEKAGPSGQGGIK